MSEQNSVLFREEQTFGRWVYWVLAADAVFVAALVFLLARAGEGEEPMPVIVLALVLAVPFLLTALFWGARLITEVRPDGLYVRFVPFHRRFRRFAFETIGEAYARAYRPLAEYGGWGIRWGWRGGAYNVRGRRGVQLVFTNGRRLLIGSQRPEELAAALQSARKV